MKEVKKGNPGLPCSLKYDKLWVGSRCYRFDMEEGRVVDMEVLKALFLRNFIHNLSIGRVLEMD